MNATLSRYGRLLVPYVQPRPSARSKYTPLSSLKGRRSAQPMTTTRATLSRQELESCSTDLDHVKSEQPESSTFDIHPQKQDYSQESNAASRFSHSCQGLESHSADLDDKEPEQSERSTTAAPLQIQVDEILNTLRDFQERLKQQDKLCRQTLAWLEGLADGIRDRPDDQHVEIKGQRGGFNSVSRYIPRPALNTGTSDLTTSQDAPLDTREKD